MSRLLVHVEGQTEEAFVAKLLAPHLYEFGFTSVSARLFGNAQQGSRRGGIVGWKTASSSILIHFKTDAGSLATTMVDYYALPAMGKKAGRVERLPKRFLSR